ncbi:hypothetical protein PPL_01977 [Heterostelium album PN500]|uniref:Prolyl 4-hydroxylase alpha subunit Fe(2+) 2OG dioxygenase domain-containing protein n=1 Tax=Heterostelium pallidum (strain ATCC 26659 / Pp 5 / PN500) TaxID=670386 RepID=D3B109_HETP5|nr:hypothetical protein PPL_01977 [Heterostelium album PN500]EFA84983.1 hypothetical protein PPL_01977 [Heterostelium album PN500]|eukprot:XP_020437093.1 hypothetical protein PPL_01977 [Heterostelium album PN500]
MAPKNSKVENEVENEEEENEEGYEEEEEEEYDEGETLEHLYYKNDRDLCDKMPTIKAKGILMGTLSYPATNDEVKILIKAAVRAPHGKGTKTVVDENVRKVWQLDVSKFEVGRIKPILDTILPRIAQELGMIGDKIKANLYKLLIYDKGSFFLPHKDSEKEDKMFGTLIALPCQHRGGDLVISHSDQTDTVNLENSDPSTIRYCAFYADCTHEVKQVTSGNRICLVYNLLKSNKRTAAATESTDIEHRYTMKTMSLAKLKGKDKAIAALFASISGKVDATPCLGMVDIKETCSEWYMPRAQFIGAPDAEMNDDYEPEFTCVIDYITSFDGDSKESFEVPDKSVIPYLSLNGTKPNRITNVTCNKYTRLYSRAAIILISDSESDSSDDSNDSNDSDSTSSSSQTTTITTTTTTTTTTSPIKEKETKPGKTKS